VCYYCQNCLVTGIGDRISTDVQFSKYYFLLVKPSVHLSTSLMYQKVKKYLKFEKKNTKELYSILINEDDKGNDFEKIIKKEYKEISELLIFLSHLDGVIFSRMTGSGSCCYAAFEKKEIAKRALDITSNKYNNYWIYLAENRIINN
jgi:4-diphosphocytidyl-2-C-methyl-D-erythritol kinase